MKPEEIGPLLRALFPPTPDEKRDEVLAEVKRRFAIKEAAWRQEQEQQRAEEQRREEERQREEERRQEEERQRQEEERQRQEELRRQAEAARRRRRWLAAAAALVLLGALALWFILRGGLSKPVDRSPEGPPLLVGEEEEEPSR